MIPHAILVAQNSGNVLMMGIQYTSTAIFNLFATQFDEFSMFRVNVYNANMLAPFNPIISQMSDKFYFLVGCIESLDPSTALMGMFIFDQQNYKANILSRNVIESYIQRKFECLGVKIFEETDISLVYLATNSVTSSIFITNLKQDPFIYPATFSVSEQWRQIKSEQIKVYQFKYVSTKNDFFYLGYLNEQPGQQRAFLSQFKGTNTYYNIYNDFDPRSYGEFLYSSEFSSTPTIEWGNFSSNNESLTTTIIQFYQDLLPYVVLWKNQTIKTNSQINVSKLSVQQVRIPKNLPKYIDCYLGKRCEIYYAKFSIANQCSDEITLNKSYTTEITINSTFQFSKFNFSEQSTIVANFTAKFLKLLNIGLHEVRVAYSIADALNLVNKWNLMQDFFILNITNTCATEFNLIKDIKNISIRHEISSDIIYYSIPKLMLGPDQGCFKQTLRILRNITLQDQNLMLFWDKLQEFQVGILANSPKEIGEYEFLFDVMVKADIQQFQSRLYQPYSFKFEVYNDVGQFSISNSAPYFLSSVLDIEANVGVMQIIDLPNI
ncbi:UNKNOWN [Stylonychia lemnae]|uniref:Uncharacterized protein n=1 Tax=Stylonychia lemnae TaxID=5949 RepID=A0A078A702_STYLE|nr:UNKNOWN [Stylonychia lemnae]|eukprot:CDW78019.1 UNKNOWN [Stylonychia lemnae]